MVNIQNPEELKKRILSLIKSINSKGNSILGDSVTIIPQTSLESFNLIPPELGFIRSIAWLYSIYFEGGKENIKYISQKFPAYQINMEEKIVTHKTSINYLRTSLQHDIFENTPHNQNIQTNCEVWYNDRCNQNYPLNDLDWKKCLVSILEEAESFFSAINLCLKNILEDKEYYELIESEWKQKIIHYHSPYEFDRLIELVASDIGIENLETVKFRERHLSDWKRELQLLKEYDFESEVRKRIERDLLQDIQPVPPFNGNDIMETFGIPPGKKVGELLKLGYQLAETHRSSKEEILEILRKEAINKGLL